MHSAKAFVFMSLALTALFCVLVGSLVYVIDPYGMNGRFLVGGVNRAKIEPVFHERLYKAEALRSRQPTAIALGTSRTERGLPMDHDGWARPLPERFNASLVGANMYELMRYFEHASRCTRLRQVVLGLDLAAFNVYKANQPDFDELLLLRTDHAAPLAPWAGELKVYFSLDGLLASIRTIEDNRRGIQPFLLDDGSADPAVFETAIVADGGQRNGFRAAAIVALTHLNFPPPLGRFALEGADGSNAMRYLERIIEIARRDNIDLRLFISPSHAYEWEALRAAGLWPTFEEWKRRLVRLLAQDARRYPGASPIALWDFSGYDTIDSEPIPAPGDVQTRMRWYWEASHFTVATGALILDRVFADSPASPFAGPADFGVRITESNIEEHLKQVRADRERYRQTHGAEVAEIQAIAATLAPQRHVRP